MQFIKKRINPEYFESMQLKRRFEDSFEISIEDEDSFDRDEIILELINIGNSFGVKFAIEDIMSPISI